ncbi:hypothetical protein CBR_g40439 [Chara braunii]|uniref:Peptidase M20 dimerisation domain-containing protein n=1 Tax=Chara braunii TaxID=69332 RepID=A0A388LTR8_CHABU|nr:hypothetical protein CBR_g40439 [Chara braunii]|eukprot:GBG85710.1 hypothetical protein CBR_g40439 [Chara braunii]
MVLSQISSSFKARRDSAATGMSPSYCGQRHMVLSYYEHRRLIMLSHLHVMDAKRNPDNIMVVLKYFLLLVLLMSHALSATLASQSCPGPDSSYLLEEGASFGGVGWTSQQLTVLADGLVVEADRLQEQIDHLSLISVSAAPAVTRVLFTSEDVAARQFIRSLMESINLTVREDAIGNMFGRWKGIDENLPPVATGSHTDAIPLSGKYDGVVGVLGGLEAVAALKRAGFVPRRSIDIIMFTSEEPTRFGIGCLGSRVMSNHPDIRRFLESVKDDQGNTFDEAAARAGYPSSMAQLDEVVLRPGTYAAFVELHIEQGPLLEAEGIPIGVVTAIAAPASLKVEFFGDGGHAGTVLMPERQDAGLGAAELALAVESAVLETKSIDTVGTTGVLEIFPGAINSIPRKAHVEIDVRDIDGARRDRVLDRIKQSVEEIAHRRKLRHKIKLVNKDPPALCSKKIVDSVMSAARTLQLQHKLMVSRAYHDSLFMAQIVPTGMIFIPCAGGISHRPNEFASKESIATGVKTLALSLAQLSTDDISGL